MAHAYGLDEDGVVAGCLAEHDRLACLARHTAQRACRGGRTDEGVLLLAQPLHARLVAEDGTACALAARVDGQDSKLVSLPEHVHAESVDARGLACARHAGDADAARVARIGQALLDDLLRQDLVPVGCRFHQRHGPAEHADIAFADALHELAGGELAHSHPGAAVRVYGRLAGDAAVDLQSLIYLVILRMLHGIRFFGAKLTLSARTAKNRPIAGRRLRKEG